MGGDCQQVGGVYGAVGGADYGFVEKWEELAVKWVGLVFSGLDYYTIIFFTTIVTNNWLQFNS